MPSKPWSNDIIERIHREYYVTGPPTVEIWTDEDGNPKFPEVAKDTEWVVIRWRCPHRHQFRLTKWLCLRTARLQYLLKIMRS